MKDFNKEKDFFSLGALIAFRKANNILSKKEALSINKSGLTLGQFAVLEILYSKGPLTISDILNGILTTSGNITVIIKNLKRDGYIIQIPNPKDRRSSLISLTENGISKIEEILPEHFSHIKDSFSDLSHEEKKLLIRLLRKIK